MNAASSSRSGATSVVFLTHAFEGDQKWSRSGERKCYSKDQAFWTWLSIRKIELEIGIQTPTDSLEVGEKKAMIEEASPRTATSSLYKETS